ncbi:MAG: ankyrin repeat domain-containing protein [Armatimonadetes bacterium]|nr:ankyrin repeat domain-containing protein [Armatimonadota bacterium]
MAKDAATTKLLLDRDAKLDAVAEEGTTMLHLAADYGYVEKVKVLLELGVDPTVKNSSGKTALEVAKNAEIEELLKKGLGQRPSATP